ncbi:MAG TPA: lipase family protein [Terriglobales bacterium]|nr:lipase family protein [Terriglobales bacterium]
MASPGSVPNGRDTLQIARQRVATSNFFALCYLMLCNLAYADENDGQKAVQQITQSLPDMPVPDGTVQGKWHLGWGPQVTQDNSNLMYAAELIDSATGLPVFSAVVIRGTDTQAKPSGILKQLAEDITAEVQVPFPANNSVGAKIAAGTKAGLDILERFTDSSNRTVQKYLNDFLAQNPDAPVVVTGHSLGGCQTTVLAMDLAATLPAKTIMVPNTFAAPTAGNSAFANLYQQTFPFAPRWFNSIDLVPMAFANLAGIKNLWTQCNRPAPEIFKLTLDAFGLLLARVNAGYTQPSRDDRQLGGGCQPPAAPTAVSARLEQAVAEIQTLLQQFAQKRGIPIPAFMFPFNQIGDWVKELLYQHLIPTGYWNAVRDWQGVASIPNRLAQASAASGN